MSRLRLVAAICAAAVMYTSCASTTVITSEPPGAQLRIDGQPVGATPVTFTEDTVWLWTKHMVQLDAPGYSTLHTQMNAQLSPLYLILGLLCLIPFLFVGEFKPTYYYVLVARQTAEILGQGMTEMATINFE